MSRFTLFLTPAQVPILVSPARKRWRNSLSATTTQKLISDILKPITDCALKMTVGALHVQGAIFCIKIISSRKMSPCPRP